MHYQKKKKNDGLIGWLVGWVFLSHISYLMLNPVNTYILNIRCVNLEFVSRIS